MLWVCFWGELSIVQALLKIYFKNFLIKNFLHANKTFYLVAMVFSRVPWRDKSIRNVGANDWAESKKIESKEITTKTELTYTYICPLCHSVCPFCTGVYIYINIFQGSRNQGGKGDLGPFNLSFPCNYYIKHVPCWLNYF